MTWIKTGTQFPEDCARVQLSDAAYRTHHEAISFLCHVEDMSLRIPKHMLRRFAGTDEPDLAAKELVAVRFWRDDGDAYVLVHHAEIVRQSLFVQRKHRDDERERMRQKRADE